MKKPTSLLLNFLFLFLLISCGGSRTDSRIYNVRDYGAAGDGKTDDAAAIQRAIDECAAAGGGKVLFPRGYTFLSGPLSLASNIEYHFET